MARRSLNEATRLQSVGLIAVRLEMCIVRLRHRVEGKLRATRLDDWFLFGNQEVKGNNALTCLTHWHVNLAFIECFKKSGHKLLTDWSLEQHLGWSMSEHFELIERIEFGLLGYKTSLPCRNQTLDPRGASPFYHTLHSDALACTSFFLDITPHPSIGPSRQTFYLGQNKAVIFNCSVGDTKAASFSWFLDYERMSDKHVYVSSNNTYSYLTVDNKSLSDVQGPAVVSVECRVTSNGAGYWFATAELVVERRFLNSLNIYSSPLFSNCRTTCPSLKPHFLFNTCVWEDARTWDNSNIESNSRVVVKHYAHVDEIY